MFSLVEHSFPCMPSTVSHLTVIDSQISWLTRPPRALCHSDSWVLKPKYATFLLEILAVSWLLVSSICKGAKVADSEWGIRRQYRDRWRWHASSLFI